MATLLAIETSTTVCSAALAVDGKVLLAREDHTGASHAALLGVFVAEGVDYARAHNLKMDAIAVSAGPGSYTGLRIGVSLAKGLCYGLDIPLIALPTLKILASNCHCARNDTPLLCPMIDARRMEVYAAIYDENLQEIRPVQADIIDENSYHEYLNKQPVVFFGNGSDKCQKVISSPNAHFVPNIYPTAQAMIPLAETAFANKNFADVAYFEPFYLKEFQAIVKK
ncbi:universal bacterial protein YeaZ [Candidatus Symbiothrix dinenymphae]|nr:universal bacterial protein YeaZ [Candidatus Symbiothrix dinenymphae]